MNCRSRRSRMTGPAPSVSTASIRPSSEGTVAPSSSPWTWISVVSPTRVASALKGSITHKVAPMRDLARLLILRARTRGRLVAARDVRVGAGVRAEVARGARVILGPGVVLGAGARISALAGERKLGRQARLGERAVIVSHAGVTVGEGAVVGDWAA